MRRARWKRKNVRRVGLRRRRPPAAGGRWLAVPCGGQGRKRAALGETSSPGKSGIHSAPIFAAANRWLMGLLQRADEGIGPYGDAEIHRPVVGADDLVRPSVQAATTARGARSEAERAEREAGQMRPCTPTRSAPSATGRQSQESQKILACPKASPNRRLHRYADPRRAEGNCTGARTSAFFSSTGRGAFSFWARPKREWGAHPPRKRPPAGAETPVAAVRRPAFPGRLITAPTPSPAASPNAPASTGAPSTAAAGGHWPPWPG